MAGNPKYASDAISGQGLHEAMPKGVIKRSDQLAWSFFPMSVASGIGSPFEIEVVGLSSSHCLLLLMKLLVIAISGTATVVFMLILLPGSREIVSRVVILGSFVAFALGLVLVRSSSW